MSQKIKPTAREIVLRENDFIVSKTDTKGKLTYCNPIFSEVSGYSELELLGKPHNIVRHPDMPRSVFKLLWETVTAGEEFFGYVKNICKDGSYYWVFATVTPSYSVNNDTKQPQLIGFFSVRRKPDKSKVEFIQDLYRDMLAAENKAERKDGVSAGIAVLNSLIQPTGKDYCEYILTL
ncbi:MAG: PAS domain-containing protein [Methylomonas sp.]